MKTRNLAEGIPVDRRAPGSNYVPFDVKVGPAKSVTNKQIFDKLGEVRNKLNPRGYGIGEK